MSTTHLDQKEIKELYKLFEDIKLDLSVNFPTRTNRLTAVENMKKVLEIHGYEIIDTKPTEEGGQ